MKLNKQKIFPFHIFLIPLFFVWHVMNEYFGLIPMDYSARFLLYYLGLSAILFLIARLLLKNNIKAGCWTSIILIIFFFWGASHDFLRSLHVPAFLSSYKFLLSVVFIFIILLVIFLKRREPPFKINNFFILLFIFFLLTEAAITAYKLISKSTRENDLAYHAKNLLINPPITDNKAKPDIFFIVFDEYASSTALKKYQHYDNSSLDSFLLKNSFYVVKNSKSNYNSTPHSLASTLNLDYFPVLLEGEKTVPKILLQAKYSFEKSLIPKFFGRQGYEIRNFGLTDLEDAPAPVHTFFSEQMSSPLYRETLWGRIEKEIWWNVGIKLPLNWHYKRSKNQQEKVTNINVNNFHGILHELTVQSDTPKFVFGHIMMPHPPYYLNKSGNKRAVSYLDYRNSRDSLYIDQLIYTNTWIDSLAKTANRDFQRPRIVIIEGDHGNRNTYSAKGKYIRERQFMNLNCWYFSDKDYSMLYDSISPVNSFRVILNKYFHTQLPLLKDSTIFLY